MARAHDIMEMIASMGTGLLAEPIAGWAGILGGGAEGVERTRDALTYRPRRKGAQRDLEKLGKLFEPIEKGKRWLGDTALEATGSPALATLAHTSPDILLARLGYRPSVAGAERAARALPDGMLKTGLLSRPDDLVAGTTLMPPDPFSAALSRKQVKEFVAKAQKERGATADWETGYGTRPGEKQDPGYMVARRGVTGTRKGRKLESTSPELTMPVVDEYVGRKHVRKALEQPGAKLGTWLDEDAQGNPLWYMDVSENIPSRQAAASALINRGEQAAFNTRGNPKRDVAQITSETFPSFPIERKYRAQDTNVRKRAAMEQASASGLLADLAAANASLATEARPNVPAGPQYWPWRIDRGGYELKYDNRPDKYDPGPGHYSIGKKQSADEKRLAKAVAKAEKDLEAGKLTGFFSEADVYEQPQRGFTFNVPYPKKAMPQWLQDNLSDPAIEARLMDAYKRGVEINPLSPEWYSMGRLYDDLLKATRNSQEKTELAMDRFGNYMGTTTASARPPQNVRMASYHIARANQGIPVGEHVQYPYGHNKYDTHAGAMRSLEKLGYIDPMKHPKGASFSGDISGLSDDAVLDKVMSNNMPLRDASGNIVDAPVYYGPARDTFGVIANKHGLKPKQLQAGAWVGDNEAGGRPLIQVLGDRIAITSQVTGIPMKDVYKNFLRLLQGKKDAYPLLSTGLLKLGGEEDQQQ